MLRIRRNALLAHTRRIAALGRVRLVSRPTSMAAAADISDGLPATKGLSLELWQSVQHEVFLSLHDPFVQGLAQGTLDRRAFQHYVAQDAYFLKFFARAYGIALSKALALDDDTFNTLSRLLRGVHEELQLHGSYAAKWGVDIALEASGGAAPLAAAGGGATATAPAAAEDGAGAAAGGGADGFVARGPSAATRAYTDFLMEVAEAHGEDGGVAEILAAMLPCSRLYGYLGCKLASARGGGGGGGGDRSQAPSHEYWDWVRTYSSPEYLAIPALKEAMFDRLAAHADKAKLLTLYRRAMQLEAEFFAAQPFSPPPRRIAALAVDFDETCTVKDSIGGLMKLAAQAAAAGRSTHGDVAWAESTPGDLADNYIARQRQLLEEILPQGAPDASSYDAAGLEAFLERLSDFDEAMNLVVEQSGILKGSMEAEVAAAGGGVELRPQCRETLRGALDRGIPVTLLSVNWSDVYVGAALGPQLPTRRPAESHADALTTPAASPASTSTPAAVGGPPIELRCNSLQVGPDGLTSGHLVKRVQTARDKKTALAALRAALPSPSGGGVGSAAPTTPAAAGTATSGNGSASASGLVVYVGDSSSDLAAMLASDVGVVVGSNRLLRRVASRFGVQLRPLAAVPLDSATLAASTAAGVLYEAAGWEEVRAFLFGVERPEGVKAAGLGAGTADASTAGGGAAATAVPAPAVDSPPPAAAAAAAAAARGSATLPRVLSIAGSDSGGGAGIQADIKAMLARGVFAMTALTALTAQNTHGVSAVHAVPLEFLAQQINAVLSDLGADAIKTGMLPNAEAVEVVAERIRHYRTAAAVSGAADGVPDSPSAAANTAATAAGPLPLVVDPVLVSTSGHSLAEGGVATALLRSLLPLATVATPNIPEAEALLGCGPIASVEGMRRAARDLQALTGCGAVLVKGGHLKPSDGTAAPHEVVDVLYDGQEVHELRGDWVHTGNTHGTGCTLASALAAELAKGLPLLPAVAAARTALHGALLASSPLCLGSGVQRPFHHLFMLPPALQPSLPTLAAVASAGGVSGGRPGSRVDLSVLRRQLRLYAVTDPHCNRKCNRTLLQAVTLAVRGGATVVQLREKDIDGGDFAREAAQALEVCRQYGVPLIINDRVDVALAVGADGVHVGQSDLPAAAVRALIGPDRILGVSVKTPAEARAAGAAGADYLGAGAVLPTGTKDTDVIGLEGLAVVCTAAAPLPVVAIGGVSAVNAASTIAAGCAGIAVVSAIFGAEDAEGAARELLRAVDEALPQAPAH